MFRKSYWKRKERLEKARKAAKAAAKAERKLKKRRLRGLDPPHERKIFSKKRGNEILDSCTKEMTLGGEHVHPISSNFTASFVALTIFSDSL